MDLIDFLKENWKVLMSAPFVFISLTVICFGGGYALARYVYSFKIDRQNDRIQDLSERLGIVARNHTKYSKYTNSELRDRVKEIVDKVSEWRKTEPQREETTAIDPKLPKPEIDRIFWEINRRNDQRQAEYMSGYRTEYMPEVICLKDEIASRLPKGARKRGNLFYENPSWPGMVDDALLDLQMLAGKLPR